MIDLLIRELRRSDAIEKKKKPSLMDSQEININTLQNRFIFFISLFGLSAILKIRNGEHAHYLGLVVAYTWNREKQMFVALGKEFDMNM